MQVTDGAAVTVSKGAFDVVFLNTSATLGLERVRTAVGAAAPKQHFESDPQQTGCCGSQQIGTSPMASSMRKHNTSNRWRPSSRRSAGAYAATAASWLRREKRTYRRRRR